PWRHATINGWILDPDRKKMSKSKGNATTPSGMLVEHGTDAVRYWAASARLGIDAALDTAQMKVGRRLAIKILNASKFALSFGEVEAGDLVALGERVTEPLDRSLLATLADVVDRATAAYDAMDYTKALEVSETFFWSFCDDYLELVKDRAYGGRDVPVSAEAATSARAALRIALDVQLRLLAPVVVFATEEVWSWFHEGSVHRAGWPVREELAGAADGDPAVLVAVSEALQGVRRVKSDAKVGMRAEITGMTLAGPPVQLDHVRAGDADLAAAGHITALTYAAVDDLTALEVRDATIVPPEPRQRS
ncbi:MAG: class I tRNA ligase family protein, partial [Lapillicoccus sp.]